MHPPRRLARRSCLAALASLLLVWCVALAHPSWQGTLDLTVRGADRVAVRARVTMEEITVTERVTARGAAPAEDPTVEESCRRHARFLAENLGVRLGGRDLAPRVASVTPPPPAGDEATYEIEFTASDAAGETPVASSADAAVGADAALELRSTVLEGFTTAAGTSWDVTYVVNVTRPDGSRAEGLLLTTGTPLSVPVGGAAAGADGARSEGASGLWAFFLHGVHHILSGYDHLLFVGALVLAASGFWDLFKVVTAFTLAHTCTLALSALDVVRLPSSVVEPMIAASIVVVALQNVFRPESARGWVRLGVAFAFGLFHGLGFAGGLLDAMEGLASGRILATIAVFSAGVEVGHQIVVLPLFLLLTLVRRRDAARSSPPTSGEAQRAGSAAVRRWGSSLISVAGAVYLFLALESAFAG